MLARAKQRKTEAVLSLPALNEKGEPFTIRGINSVSSRILGTEERERLYPPGDWIVALLKERAALNARLAEIERKLRPIRIDNHRGYGNLAVTRYEAAIDELQRDYDKAVTTASAP